ncbi:PREDICTED: uncharacterized protein LOC104763445 [Camelina sativa]|uniref:Uncharacterized protein LOC104763445 n=1 Tax=Camelina sativa TaxID=90675 RepID=A0ABM0XFA8_CAMSA|nr:PREDICTED: uncharacterized protein LOC104763445 [Camelina sativa]
MPPGAIPPGAIPPGAIPPGSIPQGATRCTSAASSHANNDSQRTLDALLSAPERESQPHLNPRKLNGALWFGVDPSVYKFVRTTCKANFMGPWRNWSDVPDERTYIWWQSFVQHFYWEPRFHDTVYYHWKQHTMTSVCDHISKKKRANKKPKYIGEADWDTLMEYWGTETTNKKSKNAAASRLSNPDGKGIHKHCAGPKCFFQIEHEMMIESGSDEPPAYTDLVRNTHTRKDGTFIDHHVDCLVNEVEDVVSQITTEDGSPHSQTATSAIPSRVLLNKEYLKRGQSKNGYVYEIGSVQYQEINPSEKVAASISRNLDTEVRISSLETNFKTLNTNVADLNTSTTAAPAPASTTAAPAPASPTPASPTPASTTPASAPSSHQGNLYAWCASFGI